MMILALASKASYSTIFFCLNFENTGSLTKNVIIRDICCEMKLAKVPYLLR